MLTFLVLRTYNIARLLRSLVSFTTLHVATLLMGWGLGGGWVGWGGVGHVNVPLHLHHEVVATSWMGWGLAGVGWGMLTFPCTCVMKLNGSLLISLPRRRRRITLFFLQ